MVEEPVEVTWPYQISVSPPKDPENCFSLVQVLTPPPEIDVTVRLADPDWAKTSSTSPTVCGLSANVESPGGIIGCERTHGRDRGRTRKMVGRTRRTRGDRGSRISRGGGTVTVGVVCVGRNVPVRILDLGEIPGISIAVGVVRGLCWRATDSRDNLGEHIAVGVVSEGRDNTLWICDSERFVEGVVRVGRGIAVGILGREEIPVGVVGVGGGVRGIRVGDGRFLRACWDRSCRSR